MVRKRKVTKRKVTKTEGDQTEGDQNGRWPNGRWPKRKATKKLQRKVTKTEGGDGRGPSLGIILYGLIYTVRSWARTPGAVFWKLSVKYRDIFFQIWIHFTVSILNFPFWMLRIETSPNSNIQIRSVLTFEYKIDNINTFDHGQIVFQACLS